MTATRKEAALATRKSIVQAAMKIVGEGGYESLTTGVLIKEAGIAKGTLYHHFDSLEDVICAMIEQFSEMIFAEVPIDKYETMEGYLADLGNFCLDHVSSNPALMNLFYGFIPKGFNNEKYKTQVFNIFKKATEQVTPAVKKFYKDKATPEKIDAAVRMVDIFSMGFCVHHCIFDDRETYLSLWQNFSQMMIKYMEA